MTAGDLTTIDKVKAWLNTGASAYPSTDDVLLGRLITANSAALQSFLSRPIPAADLVYTTNGAGTPSMFLPVQPVIAVTSVMVDGLVVPPANNPPLGSGWQADSSRVYLRGWFFTRGFQNVTVSYTAGFQISGEPVTVPDNGVVKVSDLLHPWVGDRGVASMTKVAANPASGQYALVTVANSLSYQFNTAQAGSTALVSYSYCPEDLEAALIELIGERYKKRTSVGQNSMNSGNGLVVSFQNKDLNAYCASVLKQYKNVVPQSQ